MNVEVRSGSYPTVTLCSPELRNSCTFMIDSGSRTNLIKQGSLNDSVKWNDRNIHTLQGISPQTVETLGSVMIDLMGKLTLFHIVPDSVKFAADGILGNQFLHDRAAIIDYKSKRLQYDNSSIPFTEIVTVKIRGRTVSPFYVNVMNPERQNGYIPLVTLTKGVYFGEAIVTNVDGRAYLPIINTTNSIIR